MAMTYAASAPRNVAGPVDTSHLNFEIPDVLLAQVDFKWLMAGQGWQIDMARLDDDPVYTARLLAWAMQSDSKALHHCAAMLQAQLAPAPDALTAHCPSP